MKTYEELKQEFLAKGGEIKKLEPYMPETTSVVFIKGCRTGVAGLFKAAKIITESELSA